MKSELPLSALLSQTLVAFIIEFDNEFERLTPHRTTSHGATGDAKRVPWLVSMAIWYRLLRFVPTHGHTTAKELRQATGFNAAHFKQWLARVSGWWRYVAVQPDGTVQPTQGGERALANWSTLNDVIEARWDKRFGGDIDRLRAALKAIRKKNDHSLLEDASLLDIVGDEKSIEMLPVLLGSVLAMFQKEYEEQTHMQLAMSANLLRVVTERGTPVRDLPTLTGLAKEALALLVKAAEKRGYVTVASENSRRVLKLTEAGNEANRRYREVAGQIERAWHTRFGSEVTAALRASLESLGPHLFRALEGYPEGWRASLPAREVLPHCPMISHRGGFPDGS